MSFIGNRIVVLMLAVALTACGGGTSDDMAFSPAERENVASGMVYLTPDLQVTKVSLDTIPVSAAGVERLLVNGVEVEPDKAEVRTGDRLNLAIKAPDAFGKTHTATLRVADKTLEYTLKTGTSKLRFEHNRARKALVFEWDDLDVTRYRLLHNPDGNSGYTPVLEVGGNTARAELPVAVTQLDWERGMFAVEACLSPDVSCVMLPGHEVALKQPQSVEMINYIKPLPVGDDSDFTEDYFGEHMALSADGKVLTVSVRSDQGGAVQIFRKGKDGWVHETTLTPPDDEVDAPFGAGRQALALDEDGDVLAVTQSFGAENGRAFVYRRLESGWSRDTGFTGSANQRMSAVVLSPTGERLVAGGSGKFDVHDRQPDGSWVLRQTLEDSFGNNRGDALALSADSRTLVMSDRFDNSRQGRVLVYRDSDADGEYEAPPASVRGDNSTVEDAFSSDVAVNSDGTMMLVGASGEDAKRDDPGSNGDDTPLQDSGAAYVFERIKNTNDWQQVAYLKAPNADSFDEFGFSVTMSADARWLAIGARGEQGSATGIHMPDSAVLDENEDVEGIGVIYLYERNATRGWQLRRYVKSPENSEGDGYLGFGAQVALSANGEALVVAAPFEDGAGTGIDKGDPADNSAESAGVVYIY